MHTPGIKKTVFRTLLFLYRYNSQEEVHDLHQTTLEPIVAPEEERNCWVCFASEADEPSAQWTHPCRSAASVFKPWN